MSDDLFPMARTTDPATSHIAAARHAMSELSERRRQVFDLVERYPNRTSGELGRLMYQDHPKLGIRTASASPHKRLPELEKLGFIERGDRRQCEDSGYQAHIWRVIPTQAQLPIFS